MVTSKLVRLWLLYDLCASAFCQVFSRACHPVYKPFLIVPFCDCVPPLSLRSECSRYLEGSHCFHSLSRDYVFIGLCLLVIVFWQYSIVFFSCSRCLGD